MVPLLCLFSFDTNFDKFPNYKPVGIKNRNEHLRKTIIECAWAASRTKECIFSQFSYHQTQVRKKNKMKVYKKTLSRSPHHVEGGLS